MPPPPISLPKSHQSFQSTVWPWSSFARAPAASSSAKAWESRVKKGSEMVTSLTPLLCSQAARPSGSGKASRFQARSPMRLNQ